MEILVIDVGGSHVKLMTSAAAHSRRFDSGPDFTPDQMVDRVRELTGDWPYEAVSLGYPGRTSVDGPAEEAGNLGPGWVGFDFARAFGRPVRIINDAVMQALGAYDGGRMLFLSLGTGLGSTLVAEHIVIPFELGCLPFEGDDTMADRLGKRGLDRLGLDEWMASVGKAVKVLRASFVADYVVLGGGHADRVNPLPDGSRRGGNHDAFTGGYRLWEDAIAVAPDQKAPPVWRIMH